MNTTLAYLRGRRVWLVEGLKVWGSDSEAELYMAAVEAVGADSRLGLWHISLGGYRQEVEFANLVDKRGNNLPEEIKQPTVVVLPREKKGAFIKGNAGDKCFVISKCDDSRAAVTVDLLVFETGL